MRNIYRYIFVFFGFLAIFTLTISPGFSQETSSVRLYDGKHVSAEEFDLQVDVKEGTGAIKKDFLRILYACQAARENNLSYCDKDSSGIAKCKRNAGLIMDLRSVAEGNCQGLNVFPGDVCAALNKGSCNGLASKDAVRICQAFLNRNHSLLSYENFRKPYSVEEFSEIGEEELVNIYYGYKFFSVAACDRFKSWRQGGFYLPKLMCKVLFGPDSPQKTIDDAALDLAYLNYVKERKRNLSACDRIEEPEIRDACRDNQVKSFLSFLTD